VTAIGNSFGVDSISGNTNSLDNAKKAAKDFFMEFMSGDSGDRMRKLILKSMGLTEDDLKNMTPKEREKIEAKIKEKMKELVDQKVKSGEPI